MPTYTLTACLIAAYLLVVATETGMASPAPSPGDKVPSFAVETLDGWFNYTAQALEPAPVLAMAYQPLDPTASAMWSSNSSIDNFLKATPANTVYLFLAYAETVAESTSLAKFMRSRLRDRATVIGLPQLQSQWHFATHPAQQLAMSWVPQLLANWTTTMNEIRFTAAATTFTVPRLDSEFTWIPWPNYANEAVVNGGEGCSTHPTVAKDSLLLVSYDSSDPACTYFDVVSHAQNAGAKGVIVYLGEGQAYQNMDCVGEECNTQLSISASQISYGSGQQVLQAMTGSPGTLKATITANSTGGQFFVVDTNGEVQQMGWVIYPWLRTMSWEAQWQNFKTELYANLSKPALVVPIFGPSRMQGHPGVEVNVTLPSLEKLAQYTHMELDMALGCPGRNDATCPNWDHTVHLFVCCEGSPAELCGQELGRWISPFKRRVGRWLTPVHSFMPLLTSQECTFTMQTVPWAMPWKPSLNLRFSNPDPTALVPTSIMPLFRGGLFDTSYNNRSAISFATPEGTERVELVAVITGHGNDVNGCGEFCVTSHNFMLNGHSSNVTFSEAGTAFGCAEQAGFGVEPNEGGTWLYGRDGWCDGRDVAPHVWDVTSQLKTVGAGNNTISYEGLFQGHTPTVTSGGAYIILYSHLTFYGKPSSLS